MNLKSMTKAMLIEHVQELTKDKLALHEVNEGQRGYITERRNEIKALELMVKEQNITIEEKKEHIKALRASLNSSADEAEKLRKEIKALKDEPCEEVSGFVNDLFGPDKLHSVKQQAIVSNEILQQRIKQLHEVISDSAKIIGLLSDPVIINYQKHKE